MSLDGYIARPDGAVDFLFMPEDYSMEPFMQSIDASIMGRKTYEASLAMGATYSPETTSYVYSRTLAGRTGITVVTEPPRDLVASIRQNPGKDIWLMGGGEVARSFLKDDAIDEIYIGIVPVTIGAGIPAFPGGFPERSFELTVCKCYSRGMVELRYRRVRS